MNVKSQNDSISFFVRDNTLYLPYQAYSVFEKFKEKENYGISKKVYKVEEYLNTSSNYNDYINSVIENGFEPLDYFLDSLLHEALHLCGSAGKFPLEEGINELKTRQLAQKMNIGIAGVGYQKEVEIAKILETIISKEVMDELTFIPYSQKYDYLEKNLGIQFAELYYNISTAMNNKFNKEIFLTTNPYKKAELYSQINYDEVYNLLEEFQNVEIKTKNQ